MSDKFEFCVESDTNRVKVTERRMSDTAEEGRRSLRSDKKKEEEEDKAQKGQLYGTGVAD